MPEKGSGSLLHIIGSSKIKKIWAEAFLKETVTKKFVMREYVIGSIFINLFIIVIVLFMVYKNFVPPEIPLLYGAPEGSGQLVANWMLVVPAVTSLVFVVINTAISYQIKDDYLKKTLIGGSVAITTLSSITILKIIGLISST